MNASLPSLELAYGVEPPGVVYVTVDPAHPVENTLTFSVENTSAGALEFVNPNGLTPQDALPAYADATANPLSRVYVWFPWGPDKGELATDGNATSIVASSVDSDWLVSNQLSDPSLGAYWILFPSSKSVFLDKGQTVEFTFTGIVSYLPAGTTEWATWVAAEPQVSGYAREQSSVTFWKRTVGAALSAPPTAIPGQQITLTWQTIGVSSCDLSPGGYLGLPANASQSMPMPAQPSVAYKLTAYLADGGAPIDAYATVTATDGWIDRGPFPGFDGYGAGMFALRHELVIVKLGDGSTWASPDGSSWSGRPGAPLGGPGDCGATDGEQIWLKGSADGTGALAALLSSPDGGRTWTTVNASPPWGGLNGVSAAAFRSALWVMGGTPPGGGSTTAAWAPVNSVWSSGDGGRTWQQAPPAPWSPRSWTQNVAAVFDGRLWIAGGNSGTEETDVWSSPDGESWSQAAAPAVSQQESFVTLIGAADALFALVATGDLTYPTFVLWQMDYDQNWTQVGTPAPDWGRTFWYGPAVAAYGAGLLAVGDHGWQFVPVPKAAK